MGIQAGTHGENVQLVQLGDVLQELKSSRADLGVVPRWMTMQLEVVHTLKIEISVRRNITVR